MVAGRKQIAVLCLSARGLGIAQKIVNDGDQYRLLTHEDIASRKGEKFSSVLEITSALFHEVDGMVFIMAAGIAVRALAPLLESKHTDPGVVVVDENADYAISLVGGHEGGANELTVRVAGIIGAAPVLSTGSEVEKPFVVGVGCRRGAARDSIIEAVRTALKVAGRNLNEVRMLAALEMKKDEPGLVAAAQALKLPIYFAPLEKARRLSTAGLTRSPAAIRAFGVIGACEPAALLAGENLEIAWAKQVIAGVTVSIAAQAGSVVPEKKKAESAGDLTVVGIGQGGSSLTLAAVEALQSADCIVGYRTYVKQVEPFLNGQEVYQYAMGKEIDRVKESLRLAASGKKVVLISGGDAGVYGMAGPALVFGAHESTVNIKIIPGVTAACAAAAAVGAPLMNDFAAISLSDLMTPWTVIEERLSALAGSDLVIALYNPKSRTRQAQFSAALEIIGARRPPATPAAVIRDVGGSEECVLTELASLEQAKVDMRSIVIIGNSQTAIEGGRMITARGYEQ